MRSSAEVGDRLRLFANAFEFSLKLMETCYVVAERFSSADFLHGPIALVERAFPVFLFAPPGPTLPGVATMCKKLRRLEAETVIFCPSTERVLAAMAKRAVPMPATTPAPPNCPEDLLTPIPYIIPAQLFAAFLAEQKGLKPDRPRQLSKVTKTIWLPPETLPTFRIILHWTTLISKQARVDRYNDQSNSKRLTRTQRATFPTSSYFASQKCLRSLFGDCHQSIATQGS